MKIDGEDYTAKIVVGVKNGSSYYDHRLTQIEKGNLINSLNRLSNSVAENEISPISAYKDTKLISVLQTNPEEISSAEQKIRLIEGEMERRSSNLPNTDDNGTTKSFPGGEHTMFSRPDSDTDLSQWNPLEYARQNVERAREARNVANEAWGRHRAGREQAIRDMGAIRSDDSIPKQCGQGFLEQDYRPV